MVQISIEEMQQNLSDFLKRIEEGENFIIVRSGQPLAEVKPIFTGVGTYRPAGLCRGEFTVPEDFDAPLPDDVMNAFEGK